MSADASVTAAPPPSVSQPLSDSVTVETRFGCYEFTDRNRVTMPQGPLGFQDCHNFALANLPDPRLEPFKLLQSLDDPDLSFIVTTLPADGGPVAAEDLEVLCRSAGIPLEEALFLLIVTMRPDPAGEGIIMTVNLRAPIVFSPRSRLARQCVSSNADYPLQQPFYGWGAPA